MKANRMLSTLIFVTLGSVSCTEPDPGARTPDGHGGVVSSGGAGGEGGTAGGAGTAGGTGGIGGLGGGGRGGAGGKGSRTQVTWPEVPGIWEEVQLQRQPESFRIFEGDPATLAFPAPVWEACGPGCESAPLPFGDVSGDVIVTGGRLGDGTRTVSYVGVHHWIDRIKAYVLRIIRLSDGTTIGAFVAKRNDSATRGPVMGPRMESAMSVLALDGPLNLYGTLNINEGWDFKEPWDDSGYRALECQQFDLDSSPPSYFFACGRGLEIMQGKGSSEITTIPDSEASVVGAGSHGVAVWAQHSLEGERTSRIRAWAPDEEARDLARLPGDVCGIGVGAEVVVGFLGPDWRLNTFCRGTVTNPRFFAIPRAGGEVRVGPYLPTDEMSVWSMSTSGNFGAAAMTMSLDTPYADRKNIILFRLSDWAMRRIRTIEGRSFSTSSVAVDDEHLYFAVEYNLPGNQGFDRLYRYRLDHFDQIGEPYLPRD